MQTVTKIKSRSLRKFSLITIALVGGGIFYYGWKKRATKFGQVVSNVGASILFKALETPYAKEMLGPFQGFLMDQLAGAQKLLA